MSKVIRIIGEPEPPQEGIERVGIEADETGKVIRMLMLLKGGESDEPENVKFADGLDVPDWCM